MQLLRLHGDPLRGGPPCGCTSCLRSPCARACCTDAELWRHHSLLLTPVAKLLHEACIRPTRQGSQMRRTANPPLATRVAKQFQRVTNVFVMLKGRFCSKCTVHRHNVAKASPPPPPASPQGRLPATKYLLRASPASYAARPGASSFEAAPQLSGWFAETLHQAPMPRAYEWLPSARRPCRRNLATVKPYERHVFVQLPRPADAPEGGPMVAFRDREQPCTAWDVQQGCGDAG